MKPRRCKARTRNNEDYGLLLGWQTDDPQPRIPIGFVPSPEPPRSGSRNTALRYAGEGHLLTCAPTGSGKGVGCIIPTLLIYPGPVIVVDPKGEAYRVTARRRRSLGQRVVRLDPFGLIDDQTDALNPLDLLALEGLDPEDEARTLAELLSGGIQSTRDPFWDVVSQSLLSGLIAHLATGEEAENRRLSKLREYFGGDDFVCKLATMLDNNTVVSADARQEFTIFLQHPERDTRPSVQSTAQQHVRYFGSAGVHRATDRSTFSLEALIKGEPLSIFIILPPSKLASHSSLLRLWIGTMLTALSTRKRLPELRTLLILDEAAQLGHLRALEQAITLYRGYGLQVWSMWQDTNQLRALYPLSWPTIVNNCGVLQFFGARNLRMAGEFAELVGGISAEAVLRLGADQQLLIIDGEGPLIARRPDYRSDPFFRGCYDANPMYEGGGRLRS